MNYHKVIIALCITLVLLRLGSFFFREVNYVDFYKFYKSTEVAVSGHNPYDPQDINKYSVFHDTEYNETNMFSVPPMLITLFIPLIYFNDQTASYVLLTISIVSIFIMFYLFWKYMNPFQKINVMNPGKNETGFAIGLFLFANSAPVIQSLALGQVSIISSLFIIFAVLSLSKIASGFFLAVATAFKFSLTPLYFVLLAFKRGGVFIISFICILSVLAVVLVLYNQNILDLYLNYVTLSKHLFSANSIDSFSTKGGWDMINFDYLKNTLIADVIKLLLTLIFLMICYKNRNEKYVEPVLLLLLSCTSMLLSYHRIHDMIIIIIILINYTVIFYDKRKLICLFLNLFFIGWFMIPQRISFPIQNFIGKTIGENSVIYLAEYNNFNTLFPVSAVMMSLLTIYAFFLYFKKLNGFGRK